MKLFSSLSIFLLMVFLGSVLATAQVTSEDVKERLIGAAFFLEDGGEPYFYCPRVKEGSCLKLSPIGWLDNSGNIVNDEDALKSLNDLLAKQTEETRKTFIEKAFIGDTFTWTSPAGKRIDYIYCPEVKEQACSRASRTGWLIKETGNEALATKGGEAVLNHLNEQLKTKVDEAFSSTIEDESSEEQVVFRTGDCTSRERKFSKNKCLEREENAASLIREFLGLNYETVRTYSLEDKAVIQALYDRAVGFKRIAELKRQYEGAVEVKPAEKKLLVPVGGNFEAVLDHEQSALTVSYTDPENSDPDLKFRLSLNGQPLPAVFTKDGEIARAQISFEDVEKKVGFFGIFKRLPALVLSVQHKGIIKEFNPNLVRRATGEVGENAEVILTYNDKHRLGIGVSGVLAGEQALSFRDNEFVLTPNYLKGEPSGNAAFDVKDFPALFEAVKSDDSILGEVEFVVKNQQRKQAYAPTEIYYMYTRKVVEREAVSAETPEVVSPAEACGKCGDGILLVCTKKVCETETLKNYGARCKFLPNILTFNQLGNCMPLAQELTLSPSEIIPQVEKFCTPSQTKVIKEELDFEAKSRRVLGFRKFVESATDDGMERMLLYAIMSVESGGDPNAQHENEGGSVDVGLMQFNDGTAPRVFIPYEDQFGNSCGNTNTKETNVCYVCDKKGCGSGDARRVPEIAIKGAKKLLDLNRNAIRREFEKSVGNGETPAQLSGETLEKLTILSYNRGPGRIMGAVKELAAQKGDKGGEITFEEVVERAKFGKGALCYVSRVLFYAGAYAGEFGIGGTESTPPQAVAPARVTDDLTPERPKEISKGAPVDAEHVYYFTVDGRFRFPNENPVPQNTLPVKGATYAVGQSEGIFVEQTTEEQITFAFFRTNALGVVTQVDYPIVLNSQQEEAFLVKGKFRVFWQGGKNLGVLYRPVVQEPGEDAESARVNPGEVYLFSEISPTLLNPIFKLTDKEEPVRGKEYISPQKGSAGGRAVKGVYILDVNTHDGITFFYFSTNNKGVVGGMTRATVTETKTEEVPQGTYRFYFAPPDVLRVEKL